MPAFNPVRAGTFSLLVLIFFAVTVASNTSEHLSVLPAGETVSGPYFAFGDLVEISGKIDGDLYAGGGRILINGTVDGDVLAAGGMVLISGRVGQDVRMEGGHVSISGEIGRNLSLAAGQLEMTPGASIGGGVVAAGGNLRLAGPIQEGVVTAAGHLLIDSRIGGDVQAAAGDVRLSANAALAGDLRYRSNRQAAVSPGARVGGRIIRQPLPVTLDPAPERIIGRIKIAALLMNFFSTLTLGLLLIHFYPRFSRQAAGKLQEQPLSSLGLGFGILILLPISALILVFTVIGLPLGILLMVSFLLLLYLARILPIYWLGIFIFTRLDRPRHEKLAFAVGLIIYYLLALIPLVSILLILLVMLLGSGMFLLEKWETYRSLRARELL